MKKILILNQVTILTFLVYFVIRKGIDIPLAIAVVLSILSIILNIIVEIQNARKEN